MKFHFLILHTQNAKCSYNSYRAGHGWSFLVVRAHASSFDIISRFHGPRWRNSHMAHLLDHEMMMKYFFREYFRHCNKMANGTIAGHFSMCAIIAACISITISKITPITRYYRLLLRLYYWIGRHNIYFHFSLYYYIIASFIIFWLLLFQQHIFIILLLFRAILIPPTTSRA